MSKSGLGKGLGALISATSPALRTADPEPGEKIQLVSLTNIVPSPLQPRREFEREPLEELVDSIRQRGIIQPLIVRRINDTYELIAGERRWRASKEVGLTEAPVIVRQASDLEVLELSLIENLQRADLNPIEEAQAYARLAGEFGMRQDDIAQKVGRSRASIANAMRLLDLDQQVQSWVVQGLLSVGHAKVLLGLKNHEEQRAVADTVLRQSSTVRTTEGMVARKLGRSATTRGKKRAVSVPDAAMGELENRLQQHLATHVTIHPGEKRGRIEIEYYGPDDLERVIEKLGLPPDA
jgi:ParB family chromosome partitioning protein